MKELTDFQKRYFEGLKEQEQEELIKQSELIETFKNIVANKGINPDEITFNYFQTIGITASYPNITKILDSNLKEDKEGLLNFEQVTQSFEQRRFLNGYFFSPQFMLMAHPYFRRSFHEGNNFSPRFIEIYWSFESNQVDKYIAIDSNRVRIDVNENTYRELDTWHGARFNEEIKNIPDGTVKLRPPLDIKDFHIYTFFASSYSLDIKWSSKNNIRTFQAEEFKTDDIKINKDGHEFHPVRYVHAEFDIDKNYFRHFDGAIHFYTSTEYFNRRDSDLNYNSKNSNQIKTLSQKLFKLNGKISVESWIEFTSHFFTGNPLAIEYFQGEYPQHINEILEIIRKSKES